MKEWDGVGRMLFVANFEEIETNVSVPEIALLFLLKNIKENI